MHAQIDIVLGEASLKTNQLNRLRKIITENLRVQKDGDQINYIDVSNALVDACAKQNHAIFARRGCGKTLLLHASSRLLSDDIAIVYLNCEDFKKHSFPNVLVEILSSIFGELDRNLQGWFGKKKKSKDIIRGIIAKLAAMQRADDVSHQSVKRTLKEGKDTTMEASATIAQTLSSYIPKIGLFGSRKVTSSEETERAFQIYIDKTKELDLWLPALKRDLRDFFSNSPRIKFLFLQIDDLYHLRIPDQAFVMDYIHRLCKDIPMFFKVATLRHASTLYVDRDGQPIGAQERHDYQSIDIDYTFTNFKKTERQNWDILRQFATEAGISEEDLHSLFKGNGFQRLVMAGGGVPRDVLSLLLEVSSNTNGNEAQAIGKDEVRILSKSNLERRIEELKQDSQGNEQDGLLKGIYVIRQFCLDKKSNIFCVRSKSLQQNDALRSLFYRLMDYRIIHNASEAFTHKSQEGTFQAFAIDIGCYAHLRKLDRKFNEIDVSAPDAKEKMRSAPVLEEEAFKSLSQNLPDNVEDALLEEAEVEA